MTEVQVYNDAPRNFAIKREATSSKIMIKALDRKTVRLGTSMGCTRTLGIIEFPPYPPLTEDPVPLATLNAPPLTEEP